MAFVDSGLDIDFVLAVQLNAERGASIRLRNARHD